MATQKPETAYSASQAQEYETLRLGTAAWRAIHKRESRVLLDLLGDPAPSDSILEVGCGTGRLIRVVADHHPSPIVGLDLSPHMLDQARAASREKRVQFVEGPSDALPFPTSTFGKVYSVRLLNQLADVDMAEATIREAVRVAAPGARVVLEFMNANRRRSGATRDDAVRLTLEQVIEASDFAGGQFLEATALFPLGMGAYHRAGPALPAVTKLDIGLSPRALSWTSRVMALFVKQ